MMRRRDVLAGAVAVLAVAAGVGRAADEVGRRYKLIVGGMT